VRKSGINADSRLLLEKTRIPREAILDCATRRGQNTQAITFAIPAIFLCFDRSVDAHGSRGLEAPGAQNCPAGARVVVGTNQKSEYPVKRSGVVTDLSDAGPMCSRQG
jgi:hypothetical protein